MLYLFHLDAGKPSLVLNGDEHRYIFKVRRHRVEDTLHLRNLQDDLLYEYRIVSIDKRSVELVYIANKLLEVHAKKSLHIGWCVIDPKNIEKVLPALNEMGVEKITFIHCKRSQKSFKPDFKRLHKILLNSSQQSGRSKMMQLDIVNNLEQFIEYNPNARMLHFSKNTTNENLEIDTIVVGCEGGFSDEEVKLFSVANTVGFDTPLVLKSESAVCGIASQILL